MAGGLCVRAQCLRFQEFLKIFSPLSALRAGSEKILRNSWKRTHDECYDNNVTKFLTVYFLPVYIYIYIGDAGIIRVKHCVIHTKTVLVDVYHVTLMLYF